LVLFAVAAAAPETLDSVSSSICGKPNKQDFSSSHTPYPHTVERRRELFVLSQRVAAEQGCLFCRMGVCRKGEEAVVVAAPTL
jgi:hypothetical protein